MSLNSYSNLKEINNLIVLGKYGQNCSDTIMNISINYTAQLFKKIRFLGRVELGYLNNGITYSDKSILTKERYLILSNSGLSLGCELVEYRTPVLYLGMSVGVNAYLTTLMNVKSDSSINKVSLTDLMVNIRWDLPFYFIQKSLKDLSFRCYLTFPFLYSGSLSPGLNDNNNLQLYMGVGLNYNLTRWSALEFRSILVNYDSNNSSLLSGSKINYNTVKSELIFSFTNVYDNLYELLSE